MSRRIALGLCVGMFLEAGASQRALSGTVTGRREGQFGGGVHESWVWLTGVGENAADAWALGFTWGGDFTINNVKAGQYRVGASEHGVYRHNIGPMITVPSSGTVDVQLRDRNTMDSVGLTDLGGCLWAAQTFVATGTDVAMVTVISPDGGSCVRVTIREGGPEGPQVGPQRNVVNGSLFPAFARWTPGEVPTIPGRQYAVRLDLISGHSWVPAFSYRTNQYPNGHAWMDGEPIPEADLRVAVTSRDNGFLDEYRVTNWWRSNSFAELIQTFVTRGQELRIAQMMLAGQEGYVMRVSVHQWSGSYPPGPQVGVAKHAEMSASLLQGAVWGPAEAPLSPGGTYAVRFVRADGQPFAIYGDSDDYSQGQAYFDGTPENGIDIRGCIVTRQRDLGDIVLTNTSFTPVSGTEVEVAFDTNVATTGTVVYKTGSPVFETIVPAEATMKTSHTITVHHLTPDTSYEMSILAHNPARNVRRSTPVAVSTPNESATFTGHAESQRGPVAGAKVILEPSGLSTWADESGDFSFADAPTGRHTLRMEAVAYETVTQQVEVTSDGLATAEVTMVAYSDLLDGSNNNPIEGWTEYGDFDGQWDSGAWSVYARTGPKWVGTVGNYSPKTGGIYRTVQTQTGRPYLFSGYVLTDAYGSPEYDPIEGLAVARIGVDPTGGTDPAGPTVIWGRYRFTRHTWKEIPVPFTAAGPQATLFAEHKWEDYYLLPPWYIAGFDDLWVGVERRPIPDFDKDRDVDMEDFGQFQVCLTGPGVSQGNPLCTKALLDEDDDVDPDDFAIFRSCLSGADIPYDPSCTD